MANLERRRIELSVTADEHEAIRAAAARARMTVAAWVRGACSNAALDLRLVRLLDDDSAERKEVVAYRLGSPQKPRT